MKVLVVTHIDRSVQLLLANQIRWLEQAGFTVHVVCSDGPYGKSLKESGMNVKTVPMLNRMNPLVNIQSVWRLYRLLRREKYDAVHVHTIAAGILGRLAARFARVPLILYTFRGFAFYPGASWWVKPFNLFWERLCFSFTDFIFSQSQQNLDRAIRHGVIDPQRSTVLGNGISLEEFTTSTPDCAVAIRQHLGIPEASPVVGIVCRLVKEKGVGELFQAAERITRDFPDVVFLHVGDVPPMDRSGFGKQFQEVAGKGSHSARFVFAGFQREIAKFYQAMDIFVLPSYREGMPRSIMEAMASGKPVVATDIPGCRDQVVEGETGYLVPVGDSEKLANAILKLLQDPAQARAMGEAGKRRAMKLFDERAVFERLVQTYRKLASDKLIHV